MKKHMLVVVVMCLVVGLLGSIMAAQPQCEEVGVKISPSTLNLKSQGNWVTVHAEIPYSIVDGDSVSLDGIPAASTFADDCGDLVAKFGLSDVKEIVSPGNVTMKLEGVSTLGSFFGEDTIRVIDPKKKK